MYKRKMKLSPIHISLIALAILVVIAVIVTFAVKKDEPKEPTTQSGIVYDDSAIEGGWETLSQEEIEQCLNDKVQAGMINISCNTAPYFKDGKSEGNVMLVNELNNLYPQKVEFYRNDTGEKIYESKAIAIGSKIERAKLDVELPAGEYECTAYFSNLDPDSGATLGVAGAIIHIQLRRFMKTQRLFLRKQCHRQWNILCVNRLRQSRRKRFLLQIPRSLKCGSMHRPLMHLCSSSSISRRFMKSRRLFPIHR